MIEMQKHPANPKPGGHGGHGLMMIACCIPMLILAVSWSPSERSAPASCLSRSRAP